MHTPRRFFAYISRRRNSASGRRRQVRNGYSAVAIYADMCCSQCIAQSLRRRETLKALWPFHTVHFCLSDTNHVQNLSAYILDALGDFGGGHNRPRAHRPVERSFLHRTLKFSIADTWMWCSRRLKKFQSLGLSSSVTLKSADSLKPNMLYVHCALFMLSGRSLVSGSVLSLLAGARRHWNIDFYGLWDATGGAHCSCSR